MSDWKLVLKADLELTSVRKLLVLEQKKTEDQEKQIRSLEVKVEVYEEILAEKDRRNKALTKDLLGTNKNLELEKAKPKWGNPIAWTTAAVATAVLGGFVVRELI